MKGFWRSLRNHFVPHADNAYRPHLLRRGWMVFFLAFVLATEGFLVASLVARQSGGSFLAAVIQSDIVALINQERVQNNDGPLTESPLLDAAAQAKADDMAAKGYFAHQSPDGKTPWDFVAGSGYDYQYAGENLAVRFVDSKDVVNAWMASPTHRANIVKPVYTETGVAVAEGQYEGQPATFVVQYFGTPQHIAAVATLPPPRAPVAAAAPAPVATATTVLGAEVGSAPAMTPSVPAHQTSSVTQSVGRQLARVVANPRFSAAWVFGGIATLLVLLVILAFFFHIQVQAAHMLLPGVVVAAVAILFLTFNGMFLSASPGSGVEAAVVGAGGLTTVIDAVAASTP